MVSLQNSGVVFAQTWPCFTKSMLKWGLFLTLCIWESPKQVCLQTVKTQIKCSIMLHFIRVYTVCKGKTDLQTIEDKKFENYNLTPFDMYNRLSQVYYINQKEESISIQMVNGVYCIVLYHLSHNKDFIYASNNKWFSYLLFKGIVICFFTKKELFFRYKTENLDNFI